MTVSHRQTLWKYHDYMLQFKGDKDYAFGEIEQKSDGSYAFKNEEKPAEWNSLYREDWINPLLHKNYMDPNKAI